MNSQPPQNPPQMNPPLIETLDATQDAVQTVDSVEYQNKMELTASMETHIQNLEKQVEDLLDMSKRERGKEDRTTERNSEITREKDQRGKENWKVDEDRNSEIKNGTDDTDTDRTADIIITVANTARHIPRVEVQDSMADNNNIIHIGDRMKIRERENSISLTKTNRRLTSIQRTTLWW